MNALDKATHEVRELATRRLKPLPWLEAAFTVADKMTKREAERVLNQLIAKRLLSKHEADLAQLLAQKLGVAIQWQHATFKGDGVWQQGRGE